MKFEGLDSIKLIGQFAFVILLRGTRLGRSTFSLRQMCGLAKLRSGNENEVTVVTVTHPHYSHTFWIISCFFGLVTQCV